jgi:hypothetical protein
MAHLKLACLAFCLTPVLAAAQSVSPISTDRPTYSDAVSLVPVGYWQFEAGSTANRIGGATTWTYGELLTRYGISSRLEWRISNVNWTHEPGQTSALQDPGVGFKYLLQTGSAKRPDLTAEMSTTIPVGGAPYSVDRPQGTAKLLWNQQIDANTTISGNFVVSDLGQTGSRFTQWAQSAYLTRGLNPKLSLFGEVFRLEPTAYAADTRTFYDAGIEYLINNNLQLDARFGAGFDPQTNGRSVGVGISYRY